MTTDLATSSSTPPEQDPEKNSFETGQSGTFGDIDSNPLQSITIPPTQTGEKWGILRNQSAFNLTPLQIQAIEHTIRGTHDSRIAQILSIDRKTLWNWKTFNPDYRRALATAREMLHEIAVDRYQSVLAHATDVLEEYLDDSSHKRRLRAAQVVLQMAAALKPPSVPNK